MRHVIRRSLAAVLLPALSHASSDCQMTVERRPASDQLTRIVPALGRDGMALAWQDGATISLQRRGHDCRPTDDGIVEVYRNDDFLGEVGRSGLQDVAEIGQGLYAVAWILDGNVWVRVVSGPGDQLRPPVMASSASGAFRHRAQVRLAHGSAANGNVSAVYWTSWDEDGDGWGVFATLFGQDGMPASPERQLNAQWRGFQWRPELVWCQDSLWAMWRNGSGATCDRRRAAGACDNGPMLRHVGGLFAPRPWAPEEADLGGKWPIASALACEGPKAPTSAVALWLEDTPKGRTIRWRPTAPPRGVEGPGSANASSVAVSRSAPPRIPFLTRLGGSTATDIGDVVMVAAAGIGVLMVVDGEGGAVVQVVQYESSMGVLVYEPRRMGAGTLAGVAWEKVRDPVPTMVACFVTGSELNQEKEPLAFTCERRSAQWLASGDQEMTFGRAAVAFAVMALLALTCCYLRHFAAGGGGGAGARLLARGGLESPQLRELRAQLERIPREAPREGAPPPMEGEAPEAAAADGADAVAIAPQGECGICQNEVVVRIAMTCGHTACRECVACLIDRGQPCHICRTPIVGLLPVYT